MVTFSLWTGTMLWQSCTGMPDTGGVLVLVKVSCWPASKDLSAIVSLLRNWLFSLRDDATVGAQDSMPLTGRWHSTVMVASSCLVRGSLQCWTKHLLLLHQNQMVPGIADCDTNSYICIFSSYRVSSLWWALTYKTMIFTVSLSNVHPQHSSLDLLLFSRHLTN